MGFFQNGQVVEQVTTTATAAGTTTLTATSHQIQYFTGSTTQIIKLAPTTSMTVGQWFEIYNSSTGALTIQFQDGTSFTQAPTISAGQTLVAKLTSAGTTNGTWAIQVSGGTVTSVALSAPALFTVSGSPVVGSGTLAISYSGTALPIANGGTNNTGAYTAGSILFSNGTSITQDNSKLFWDDSNGALGIGTATPASIANTSLYIKANNPGIVLETTSTTSVPTVKFFNSASSVTNIIGTEDNGAGGGGFAATAYSLVLQTNGSQNIEFFTNNSTTLASNRRMQITTSTVNITGVTDNSSASTGIVGEYIQQGTVHSAATTLTANTPTRVGSMTLTAGDWEISGSVGVNTGSSSATQMYMYIVNDGGGSIGGTITPGVTDTLANGTTAGNYTSMVQTTIAGTANPAYILTAPAFRVTQGSTFTLSLGVLLNVTGGGGFGLFQARRVR